MKVDKLYIFGTLFLAVVFFWQWLTPPQGPMLEEHLLHEVYVEGYVSEEPIRKETYIRFTFFAQNILNNEKIFVLNTPLLVYTDLGADISYGDLLTLKGTVSQPENKSADFDWVSYLSHRGIFFELSYPKLWHEETGRVPFFVRIEKKLLSIKYAFSEKLGHVIHEPAASLAAGELLGEKRNLPKQLDEALTRAGVSHIVVLSGYNVTIVAESIMRSLSYFPRTVSIYGAIIGIFLFVGAAGFSASVLRAALMASILLLARQGGALYSARRALFIVALIMIFFKPSLLLYDASFQLSFLATAGILYSQKFFERKLSWIPARFGARELLATTLAAQAAVLPLLIHLSGGVQILSLIANMLILPTVPAVMFLSLVTGTLGFFSYTFSSLFGIFTSILLFYQVKVILFIGSIPWAHIPVPHITAFFAALFYIFFFVKIVWKEEK